jgi:glycosyltransferase involved in cell wall biosynthesis
VRVALLSPKPQRRGAELFSRRLAGELRRLDHTVLEVYLYPAPAGDGLPRPELGAELRGEERHWLERFAGWHPEIPRRLRRVLAEFEPDVVQANGGRTVKYGALVSPRLPRPPVLIYRNIGEPSVWVRGWRRKLLYSRLIFPRIDGVATIAKEFLPAVRSACKRAAAVRWIPSGVDERALSPTLGRHEVRAALGTEDRADVVLFAGKLSEEKRVDRLLRAFSVVRARNDQAVLWIAGGGPLEDELRQLAERLGCADSCHFLGVRSDVGNLIASSDLVALSSDTEGVPIILRETAALGRPAVATRAGATAELVEDGVTGLVCERDDETGFADALSGLLADPERRSQMGEAARRGFERNGLSMTEVANRYESLYREALAARASEGIR